jgi:lipopolysaccharide export system protein LptC
LFDDDAGVSATATIDGTMSVDVGTPVGSWNMGRQPANAAVWRAARRHSRIVRSLRVVLPLIAVGVVASLFVSARTLPRGVENIDLGDIGMDGTTLTMQNPSLSGFNDNGTSYQVTAGRALQDVTNPRVVTLESIDGTMTKPDGSTVKMTAKNGVFDADTQKLELSADIEVRTSTGDHAFLESAKVDMQAGSIVTDKPVRAATKSGNIRADSMEITGRGEHLLFSGNVVVELRLDGGDVKEALGSGTE